MYRRLGLGAIYMYVYDSVCRVAHYVDRKKRQPHVVMSSTTVKMCNMTKPGNHIYIYINKYEYNVP